MIEDLLLALLFSFVIQIIFFVFAAGFKTDKVTDLSYGLSFILISVYFFFKSGHGPTQTLTTLLVCIWAIRLAGFLLRRIFKIKKDPRFDKIRDDFWKFAMFWFFQAISVWIILLPTLVVLLSEKLASTGTLQLVGAFIWLIGFATETIADQQKSKFKNNPENKNTWINTGLWKYSRHPNYFGEILIWVGLFIVASPFLEGYLWLTLVSPIFIIFILTSVSGIPPVEKFANQRYGSNPNYQDYKKRTSILIPLPPKK